MSDGQNGMDRYIELLRNLSVKARQQLLLGGLAIVFFALVFGGVYIWDSNESIVPQSLEEGRPSTRNITAPGTQIDPREVWMTQSAQQLSEMDEIIRSMRQKLEELERKQQPEPDTARDPGNFFMQPTEPLPPPVPETLPLPPPVQEASLPAGSLGTGYVPPPQPYLPPPMPPMSPEEPPATPGIAVFQMGAANSSPEDKQDTKVNKTYLPTGSFMRAVLLGGMDAPTGGQAQNNPMPVLLRVQDNAFLPNRYRARLKECFVLGSGHGDISSERAHIRLESLSCTLNGGEVLDLPAKGYIVSEDGKAGLRGRLISKQGQVIANALMTGILSGFGQALQQSAMSFSTSPLGSVGTISGMGKQFQGGLGAGIGRSLDRISQYYIRLAEQLFPVIEIDAGRVVEIVLTKGLAFELGEDQEILDLGVLRNRPRRLTDRRG